MFREILSLEEPDGWSANDEKKKLPREEEDRRGPREKTRKRSFVRGVFRCSAITAERAEIDAGLEETCDKRPSRSSRMISARNSILRSESFKDRARP